MTKKDDRTMRFVKIWMSNLQINPLIWEFHLLFKCQTPKLDLKKKNLKSG